MNEGWIEKTLGDACNIARGGSPRPIQAFLTDAADGVNWVKISDATASDKFIFATAEKIKPAGVTRSRLVHDGDFLLSNSMSFGRPYIMRTTGCVHDGWLVLSDYQSALDPNFLYFLLSSPLVYQQFDRLAAGSTVRNLNIELASRVVIPIPPLPKQRRIVAILDEAFNGIATAKANAEKNLKSARALFESHLQSVFSQRGEGWTQRPLGELCELISGQHIDAADYNTESRGIGYLTGPSDFGEMHPVVTKWTEFPKRMARARDILITVKGSGVGKINLMKLPELAISRQLMAIRATAAEIEYLHAFLTTKFDYFQSLANGAAIPGISRGDVLHLLCPMPPSEEMPRIMNLIKLMADKTQRLESIYQQKLAALAELKKSLLHQAFSGAL